ncbi:hypothetical protein [Acinetobacter johnsonii]|uniref:hypothetical protein n=1 Tax=Acinetobacter johnsonii TaxID=40214 RepID=UPI003D64E21E
MIVITIIAILTALVLPTYQHYVSRAQIINAIRAIWKITKALLVIKLENVHLKLS